MMARKFAFLVLPSELRINIYDAILSAVSDEPSPWALRPYHGFILANKQVESEFSNEWNPRYLKHLKNTIKSFGMNHNTLSVASASSLRKGGHVTMLVTDASYWNYEMKIAMSVLLPQTQTIIFKLDAMLDQYDGSIRGFLKTKQCLCLASMRTRVAQVHDASVEGQYISREYRSFRSLPPIWHQSGRPIVCRINYWNLELYYSRVPTLQRKPIKGIPVREDSTVHTSCERRMWDERSKIEDAQFESILHACSTMEQLKGYRNLIESSEDKQDSFEVYMLDYHFKAEFMDWNLFWERELT